MAAGCRYWPSTPPLWPRPSGLWVTEYILAYDGKPSYTVSIMEFRGEKVARETQYFADAFEAAAWRAQWVERTDSRPITP